MTRFQGLAVGAAASTLVPIAAGGVVRATGSGDGCPDWPRCFGKWIPPLEYHALIEYSHRSVAAVSGLILLWLAVVLIKDYRRVPQLFWPGLVALPLVLIQGWLGKLVVEGGLSPAMVTAHLANAMLLAGVLVVLALNSFFFDKEKSSGGEDLPVDAERSEEAVAGLTARLATVTAIASLFLILTGAYMRAMGGALVFLDWPLMNSSLIPSLNSIPAAAHFTHRVATVAVGVVLVVLISKASKTRSESPGFYRLSAIAGYAFLAQAGIGAANVFTRLAPWARSLHVVFATLVWGALVGAATLAHLRAAGRTPLIQLRAGDESVAEAAAITEPVGVGEAR